MEGICTPFKVTKQLLVSQCYTRNTTGTSVEQISFTLVRVVRLNFESGMQYASTSTYASMDHYSHRLRQTWALDIVWWYHDHQP